MGLGDELDKLLKAEAADFPATHAVLIAFEHRQVAQGAFLPEHDEVAGFRY